MLQQRRSSSQSLGRGSRPGRPLILSLLLRFMLSMLSLVLMFGGLFSSMMMFLFDELEEGVTVCCFLLDKDLRHERYEGKIMGY